MENKIRILSIDDAVDHQSIISAIFDHKYALSQAFTLAEAEALLAQNTFDLILLDVIFPDGDGFNFYAKLRPQPELNGVSVIFLTSASETPHEIMGFSLGAVDYILKPIDPPRLKARIEARIKQLGERRQHEMTLQRGNLKVSVPLQKVAILCEGRENMVNLTPIEFKLLLHLLKHEDHVFSRVQLLETIWGKEAADIFDRTVDMHVSNLRKKLTQSEFKIQAVHRAGYRLTRASASL